MPVKLLSQVRPLVSEVKPLFEPVVKPEPRPTPTDPPEFWRYARTYLLLRVLVGVVGILLPLGLLVLDLWVFRDSADSRGSLSAYYYSGGRELFVAGLVLMGTVLGTYKVFEWNLDNLFSFFAGLAAVLVAFFPTGRYSKDLALTPLQREWGEGTVQGLHFAAAGTLIVLLGVLSVTFGVREGSRPPAESDHQKSRLTTGGGTTSFCAAVIFAALATFGVSKLGWTADDPEPAAVRRVAAAWAFAASWFAAGWSWPVLSGHGDSRTNPAAPGSQTRRFPLVSIVGA